nr:MAG TPA: hypothetical protein [Caudoviricetes sp.]
MSVCEGYLLNRNTKPSTHISEGFEGWYDFMSFNIISEKLFCGFSYSC